MMKTMTATTPPITAWSTPEDVDMAVGSSEEVRQWDKKRSRGQDQGKEIVRGEIVKIRKWEEK